jgi:molecular chaperone DnaK
MSLVLGIDLGTSYSCAAAVRDDDVVVVPDDQGRRTLPSVVHFGASGHVTVGHEARPSIVTDPANTIHAAKRFLGRRFSDGSVRIAQSAYLYRVSEGPNQWPMIDARGGPYTVPEICACVLQELKTRAERYFRERIERAVVTVPANADDAQREQTRIAGRIAGLEVVRLLNEPTAAALAYAASGVQGRRLVVYDFGGGTFDCSVIDWGADPSRVLATHGDSFLGGDDIDLAMAERVADDFRRTAGVDLRARVSEWKALLLACEAAKRELSRSPKATVRVDRVAHVSRGTVDLAVEVDRRAFDRWVEPIVRQTVESTLDAVALAGLDIKDVDEVVAVGGSSRIPRVRALLGAAFGRQVRLDLDPDTTIAIGAALEAQRIVGGRMPRMERAPRELIEVVPRSIGLATVGGGFDPIIRKNATLPASGQRSYTTWRDGQQEMRFVVLQGDSERAEENIRLGQFVVSGLPPRPAGQVEVWLLFEVSSDGLLRASARDTTTNRVHRYRVRVADSLRGE